MNKGLLVSIVLLNYNGLSYLKKTIPSILRLDYPNYEIIVVDNGSTDGSIDFIRKYKKISLIKNLKNLGYSRGKNIGIKSAHGDYIFLLDNDILIRDKKIIKKLLKLFTEKIGFVQIPLLDEDKETTYYYGVYYSIYGVNLHKKEVKLSKILKSKESLEPIGGPIGGNLFFNKGLIKEVGLFDESQEFNIDDVDIGPRSWILGYPNKLYTKSYATHLGIKKTDDLEVFCKRFRLLFSGHARSMIKIYRFNNLLWALPALGFFQLIKAIKYSIKKRSLTVFGSFFYSVNLFIKNLPDTLKERKKIQSKRVIKEDIFLKIKPPKFK